MLLARWRIEGRFLAKIGNSLICLVSLNIPYNFRRNLLNIIFIFKLNDALYSI